MTGSSCLGADMASLLIRENGFSTIAADEILHIFFGELIGIGGKRHKFLQSTIIVPNFLRKHPERKFWGKPGAHLTDPFEQSLPPSGQMPVGGKGSETNDVQIVQALILQEENG